MSFAPPSSSEPGGQFPPPPQQPPAAPNWFPNSPGFPGGAPVAPAYPPSRPSRSGSGLLKFLLVIPLIGLGATAFFYFDAKNEAKQARDDVLATVNKSLDALDTVPEVTIPVISVPDVTVPVVGVPPESVVTPATVAAGAVAAGAAATVSGSTELWTAEGSAALVAAYESTISGEPTRFLDLRIYRDYAFANAQDAAVPEHVDEYPFRSGSIGASSPVQLVGDGDLESSLWTLADVDLTMIPRIVTEAPMVSNIEEPEVVYVRIERSSFIAGGPVTVKVYIDGPRSSGFVEYDAAGNVIDIVV